MQMPHEGETNARQAERQAHHLPHQNALVRTDSDDHSTASESGGGWRNVIDTGKQRGDWYQPDWMYQCSGPQMPMQMWPTSFGASMSKDGWISMMKWSCVPTFFGSLQGYPGKWACSLPGWHEHPIGWVAETHGSHLRECVWLWQYDPVMLYEIHQKENETMEEYMLRVHEAVAVVRGAYPDQVPNEGEGLRWDHASTTGLIPSLRDVLSFAMADLPEREQADTSFDTLYHLAKKSGSAPPTAQWHDKRRKLQHMSPTKVTWSIPLTEDVQLPCRGRTVPTQSWAGGECTTRIRPYGRTVTENDTGNEPLPKAGMLLLFCLQGYRSLCMELPTSWSFPHLA